MPDKAATHGVAARYKLFKRLGFLLARLLLGCFSENRLCHGSILPLGMN